MDSGSIENLRNDYNFSSDELDIYFWELDTGKRHLELSPGFREILGYTQDDINLVTPDLPPKMHPDDVELTLRKIRSLIYGKSDHQEFEYRLENETGNWGRYYCRCKVLKRRQDGSPGIIGGLTLSIAPRYKGVVYIYQEAKKFEFIFKNISEPVMIVRLKDDLPYEIVDLNKAATDLFGHDAKELSSRIPGGLSKLSIENLDTIISDLKSGKHVNLEIKVVDFTGVVHTLDINAYGYTPDMDDLVIAIISDKTEKLVAEENEVKYRALVEAADDRIALYDTEGNRILTNSAYYTQLGYTKEEYEEKPLGSLLHPDDKYLFKGHGIPVHLVNSGSQVVLEYRIQNKNGHYQDMMAKLVPVRDANNRITGYLEIVRDITPLKKVEQQLRIAKEKAEESDHLKSAFLANMSHEIRTPMNSIVGFSNLLISPSTDGESRKEYVKRINRNSEQLLALISDIIDLAKIESKQISIIRSRVMLNQLLQELYLQFQQEIERLEKRNLKLILEIGNTENDISVFTDYVRLTQVLQNLLNNAIKFTIEGEIRLGYSLIPNNRVLIYVADTGIGIARENFDIIFDQFRQIDGSKTRSYGGTGLGLAICKNLVNLMGGKIWVESEPGKGTIFYTELPLGGLKETREGDEDPERVGIPDRDYSGLKVIVVDDNLNTQVLLTTIFREFGITPQHAGSSEDLLGLIRAGNSPDLILLNIQLPDVSGEEILPLLRDMVPQTMVVVQSPLTLSEEREKSARAGFDEFITKPFDRKVLLSVLEKFFNN